MFPIPNYFRYPIPYYRNADYFSSDIVGKNRHKHISALSDGNVFILCAFRFFQRNNIKGLSHCRQEFKQGVQLWYRIAFFHSRYGGLADTAEFFEFSLAYSRFVPGVDKATHKGDTEFALGNFFRCEYFFFEFFPSSSEGTVTYFSYSFRVCRLTLAGLFLSRGAVSFVIFL